VNDESRLFRLQMPLHFASAVVAPLQA